MHRMMTKAAHRVLVEMAKAEELKNFEDAEIVCDGDCWIGNRRIPRKTVTTLLRLVLVADVSDVNGCDRYALNSEGRAMSKDIDYVPEITNHFAF